MTSTLPVPPTVSPPDEHAPPAPPGAPRSRAQSLLRGPAGDPAWVRPALMGVASVGLLFATLRRWYGPVAGLVGGAVLALTPIATLMFRFNNPDALLVLMLMAGGYATVRALEAGATRW